MRPPQARTTTVRRGLIRLVPMAAMVIALGSLLARQATLAQPTVVLAPKPMRPSVAVAVGEGPFDPAAVAEFISPHVSVYTYPVAPLSAFPLPILPEEAAENCDGECCISAVADGNPQIGQRRKGTCTRMRALRFVLSTRPTMQLIDALVSTARARKQSEVRVHFIGDSVLFQAYENVICHLRRFHGTGNLTRLMTRSRRFSTAGWKQVVSWIHDTRVRIADDVYVRLVMVRQYRPALTHADYPRYFRTFAQPCDALVTSWGLHYLPHERAEFEADMADMARWLRPIAARGTAVVWMGSSAQHFNATGGEFADSAMHDTCVALSRSFSSPNARRAHARARTRTRTRTRTR